MIEFHADDYGIFPEAGARIRKCIAEGVLNGISIMPNSPFLQEEMEALRRIPKKVRIAVHLNFVHGTPLSPKEEVPHLVRGDGTFRISYAKALFLSYCPGLRSLYKEEFKREIRAQFCACDPFLPPADYRVDSHLHYLMIPMVFDAFMELLQEEGREVSYIRMPAENRKAYARCRKETEAVPPVNVVKVLLLNVLAARNRRKYEKALQGRTIPHFYGVLYSGRMNLQNVSALLSDYQKHYPHEDAEFLFHPGAAYESDAAEVLTAESDRLFMTSPNRQQEMEAVLRLSDILVS